ncbi:MAG TPA: MtaA/CmuA family methyltransferase [Anaerolineae bacterium]|nr:MtaA/CmuA family methyltransferase [Anaerolineae bacterium]
MRTVYPMTPRRRLLSGIFGGRTDRPPVGTITSVATVEQMTMTGAFFPDVHMDAEKTARLAACAYEDLGYDVIVSYFSIVPEAAALGCEIDWGTVDTMPSVRSHPWSDPDEVRIPADFLDQPSIRVVLDAIRMLRKKYGHQVAIVGKALGPWTLAYHVHGLQRFLIATIDEPDKVRAFLERLKEVTVLFAIAQIQAGADLICLGDHATGDLVGPWVYRDYLVSIHRELTQRLGCPTVLHLCGNTLDRLDYICEEGFDCFHFDSKVDARAAVEKVAGRISLMGNINNVEVLQNGTPALVAEHTRYVMDAGVQVIGPECAVPLRTPNENLKTIANTVREASR